MFQAALQSLLAESDQFLVFVTGVHASPVELEAFLIKKRVPACTRKEPSGFILIPGAPGTGDSQVTGQRASPYGHLRPQGRDPTDNRPRVGANSEPWPGRRKPPERGRAPVPTVLLTGHHRRPPGGSRGSVGACACALDTPVSTILHTFVRPADTLLAVSADYTARD